LKKNILFAVALAAMKTKELDSHVESCGFKEVVIVAHVVVSHGVDFKPSK
jgi:hypothetical protein